MLLIFGISSVFNLIYKCLEFVWRMLNEMLSHLECQPKCHIAWLKSVDSLFNGLVAFSSLQPHFFIIFSVDACRWWWYYYFDEYIFTHEKALNLHQITILKLGEYFLKLALWFWLKIMFLSTEPKSLVEPVMLN
jgi:hypothetical protein